jgi:two-component system chemotaxis sensor kinase CheA
MTSGKPFDGKDEASMDTVVRYMLLNALIFTGGACLFFFGFDNVSHGETAKGIVDFAMGCMAIATFVVLRTPASFIISGLLTVVPYGILCALFIHSGGAQGSGILWSFSFPMMAIFLLGMRLGSVLSVALFVYLALAVFNPGFTARTYPLSFAYRAVGVYTMIVACTIVYERSKLTKDRWVARLTRALKAERDEVAAMKDNLKVGLFMMDRDFAIQPQYSRALETVLSEPDIAGKRFPDLLSSSLQQKELDTIADYFTMVLNRSFDAEMLEDINPLNQLAYVSVTSGEEKRLRCGFAPIDREDGKVYILGTVEDVTREATLQMQLSEEENKRQEEMRSLFEVIHVEPRVLNDFIEDAEYEFNRINEVLKENDRSAQSVMVEIYQGVHAIKSNAAILGLTSFATKLHALEDELKVLRERHDISFQEILHVTVELDKLMKVKDGFKDLIGKILSFNMGETRMQEEHVLVQTLERVIEKTSADLGKKAKLVVKGINPRAMECGPRRAIKEVLTQLVRNSMVHGIESPSERAKLGKDSSGVIKVSVDIIGDKLVVQLTDDGRGLDFAAIRAKAEEMNLIADPKQLDNRNALLQVLFMPGFSTAKTVDLHAGRGIGLNLVRERVKELKGSIKLQSEEGKGTVFRIFFPVDARAAQGVQTA